MIPVSESASEPVLLIEDEGPVRRLTMNRPGSLNALDHALLEALVDAIGEAGRDDAVRVVVLAAAGRAFCAGYDLSEDADGGLARHRGLAPEPRERHRPDAHDPRLPQAGDRERPELLPGRRDRPDARLRPGRRRRRRLLRLRRRPLRLRRRLDVPAVGGRRAHRQGAAVHRRGPDPGRRGAPDRPGEPGGAARRARRGDDGAGAGDREERAVRGADDEARAQPRVGRRRVPRARWPPTPSST